VVSQPTRKGKSVETLTNPPVEAWRKVLRVALGLMSDESLVALRKALVEDDERLIQGATTKPPPLACLSDLDCEGACLVGYAGMADGLETMGEVEEYSARMFYAIDNELGEPAGVRHLLNFWDETPRQELLSYMIPEVNMALDERRRLEGSSCERSA